MKNKLNSTLVMRHASLALLASLILFTTTGRALAQTGPGYALSFNGTNAYVAIAPNNIPLGSFSYTIEAWIKPNSMGNYGILGWGIYGTTNGVNVLTLRTNGLANSWWGNDLVVTTNLVGQWHHVAATYDGTYRRIYVDGILRASNTNPPPLSVLTDTNVTIGKANISDYFNGSIDEVRVWSSARNADQIRTNMYARLAAPALNLAGYWRFDEGTGLDADSATFLNDGTLVNNPVWVRSGAPFTPEAATSNATETNTASARLNAKVHPGNLAANAWFQWGTTTNYGTNTPQISVGPALPDDTNALSHAIASVLTNLALNTTYYFRVAITNSAGTNYGGIKSFTTLPLPSGPGCAVAFDGMTNYFVTPNLAASFPNTNVTIEMWFQAHGPGVLVTELGQNAPDTGWYDSQIEVVTTATNTAYADVRVRVWSLASPGLTLGQIAYGSWNHVVLRYDQTTATLDGLVNGVAGPAISVNRQAPYKSGLGLYYTVGRGAAQHLGSGANFDGQIDELRLWNLARTTADLQANLYRPLAGNEPGLVAYWQFDECSGTLASDTTGHGNAGVLYGNVTWGPSSVHYGPGITTLPATNLTTTSVLLKGTTHPQGFATTAWFQWGATTNYGNTTTVTNVGSGVNAVALSTNITGLASFQTYHFRAAASNSYGVSYGKDQSFWLGPPLVTSLPATDLTTNAATVNGSVIPSGPSAQVWFQYGLTTNYDSATVPTPLVSGTLPVAVTNRLQPLLSGYTYHYRIVATNSFGVALGSDLTFTGPVLGEIIVAGLPGVAASSVAWGDYDNDGDLDILLTGFSSSGNISRIYRNNGNGTFTDHGAGLPGLYFSSVAWGDYDNDGDLDTLLTGSTNGDSSGTISKIYRNNGAGPFTDINASLPGVYNSSVAWGDYDNDGNLDILLTGFAADPTIFLADFESGNNGFTYVPDPAATSNLWHRTAHRFASPNNSQYYGLESTFTYDIGATTAGYLQSPLISLAGSAPPISLSFNYSLQTEGGTYYDQATVAVSTNAGSTWTTLLSTTNGTLLATAVFANKTVDLSAYAGRSILLRFNFNTLDNIGNNYEGWYIDDVTITRAIFGPSSRVYHNSGDGTFTDSNASLPGVYNSSVAWGDYDKDGDLDILLTGYSGGGYISRIYRNNGNSTFTDLNAGLPGVYLGSVAWGDYNNDGDLDILLTGQASSGRISRIYRNNGNSTFTDLNAGLPGVERSSVAWGDYDNDGYPDILLTGDSGGGDISRIYRNNGNGTFPELATTSLPGVYYGSVAWGDYDNDGRLDILLTGIDTGSSYVTHLYHNYWLVTNTIPAAPRNLTANVVGTNAVLSWSVGSDLQTPALGLSYNLRVGTTPGGSNVVSPQAATTGFRRVPQLGNMQQSLAATLTGLKYGSNYYWSVQAVDTAFAGSPFVNSGSFAVTLAPSAAAVQVGSVMGSSAVLGATIYPNGSPTTAYFQWGTTANYGNSSAPAYAGSGMGPVSLRQTLTGLQPGTRYHYRVVTINANGTTYGSDQTFYVDPAVLIGDGNGDGMVDGAELNAVLASYWPTSPWLYITNTAGLGGTNVTFALPGSTAGAYSVLMSTNLAEWDYLGPATPRYEFTDTNAPTIPQRYYRLRWP